MKKVYRHELIEVLIPANATATKFMIPDQPNLRNMKIMGVEAYTIDVTPASPLSGTAVISATDLKKIYLTLQDNAGDQFINLLPLGTLKSIQSEGEFPNIERDFKSFTGQIVNYPKSFLTMSSALANGGALVVLLSITYLDPNKNSQTTFRGKK